MPSHSPSMILVSTSGVLNVDRWAIGCMLRFVG